MVTKRHLSHSPCPAASIVVEIEKAENLENQFMLISPPPCATSWSKRHFYANFVCRRSGLDEFSSSCRWVGILRMGMLNGQLHQNVLSWVRLPPLLKLQLFRKRLVKLYTQTGRRKTIHPQPHRWKSIDGLRRLNNA